MNIHIAYAYALPNGKLGYADCVLRDGTWPKDADDIVALRTKITNQGDWLDGGSIAILSMTKLGEP